MRGTTTSSRRGSQRARYIYAALVVSWTSDNLSLTVHDGANILVSGCLLKIPLSTSVGDLFLDIDRYYVTFIDSYYKPDSDQLNSEEVLSPCKCVETTSSSRRGPHRAIYPQL